MPRSTLRLEKERNSKKKAEELAEIIDVTGQDNENKGIKAVQEIEKENFKNEQKLVADSLERLTGSRRTVLSYKEMLISQFIHQMLGYDLPPGFNWVVESTSKGIALFIRTPDGRKYGRGIKVVGEPKYDYNAMMRLIIQAFDFIEDKAEKKTKGGIVLS